jgi:hypothetical protein
MYLQRNINDKYYMCDRACAATPQLSLSENDDIIQVTTGSIGLKYNVLSVC